MGIDERELRAAAAAESHETLGHRRRIEGQRSGTARSARDYHRASCRRSPRRIHGRWTTSSGTRRHLGLRTPGPAEVDGETHLVAIAAAEVHRPCIDGEQAAGRVAHETRRERALHIGRRERQGRHGIARPAAGVLGVEVEIDALQRPCTERELEDPAAVRGQRGVAAVDADDLGRLAAREVEGADGWCGDHGRAQLLHRWRVVVVVERHQRAPAAPERTVEGDVGGGKRADIGHILQRVADARRQTAVAEGGLAAQQRDGEVEAHIALAARQVGGHIAGDAAGEALDAARADPALDRDAEAPRRQGQRTAGGQQLGFEAVVAAASGEVTARDAGRGVGAVRVQGCRPTPACGRPLQDAAEMRIQAVDIAAYDLRTFRRRPQAEQRAASCIVEREIGGRRQALTQRLRVHEVRGQGLRSGQQRA